MYQFIVKIKSGKFIPTLDKQKKILDKILNYYEHNQTSLKVTIEIVEKNINESQISLYKAFVIKASNHFGNTFKEMQMILENFHPMVETPNSLQPKSFEKWTSKELDTFINQATAFLAEYGFNF